MFFAIDPSNGIAIYDQIVRQVTYAIAAEAIKPGEKAPSVRELARLLAVNPNTTARALRELQSRGVLEAIRGEGLQVTSEAPDRCRDERRRLIQRRIREALVEGRRSQLALPDLRAMVDEELSVLEAGGDN